MLLKRLGIFLLVVIVGIQFIPTRQNRADEVPLTDFVNSYKVPDNIDRILHTSCYNCHSNNTNYPWYTKVQPVGWFLERHIKEAKSELNLSEFASYSVRKQKSKLKSMVSQIEKNKMPLSSYTFIHRDAKLSGENKTALIKYLESLMDSL